MTWINDTHVGKLAVKQRGFFGGLVGKVVKTDDGYALEFGSGSMTAIVTERDVEFIEEELTHD